MRLLGLAGALTMTFAAAAHADAITLTEKPDHVTEGVVTIDAPPDAVYRVVTDYASWPSVLGDVMSAHVEAGGRDDARLRFRSRALEHEVTVVFTNIPDQRISFRAVDGPPGARASGTYTLEPIDGGTRSRVTADLYLDVVGVAGWLVRDARVREMRREKLARDLADVAAYFVTHRQ